MLEHILNGVLEFKKIKELRYRMVTECNDRCVPVDDFISCFIYQESNDNIMSRKIKRMQGIVRIVKISGCLGIILLQEIRSLKYCCHLW